MAEEAQGYHVIICPVCDGQGCQRLETTERIIRVSGEHGPPSGGSYTKSCWRCDGRGVLAVEGKSREVEVLERALELMFGDWYDVPDSDEDFQRGLRRYIEKARRELAKEESDG